MNILEAVGRIFISVLFLYEAIRKFFNQIETIDYMENYGIPEFLFYPSLLFELVIPILLISGFLIIASYEAKKFTIDYYLKYKKK